MTPDLRDEPGLLELADELRRGPAAASTVDEDVAFVLVTCAAVHRVPSTCHVDPPPAPPSPIAPAAPAPLSLPRDLLAIHRLEGRFVKPIVKTLASLTALAGLLASPAAHAQKWVPTGLAELSTGVEGGGGSHAASMDSAPIRMRVGGDMYVDEDPENIYGAAVLFAVASKTAFGVDARYTRVVRQKLAFSVGATAILQPGSLVGPTAAAEYRMPLGKSFTFTAGPEVNVFCLGSDLPDRTVIWQLLVKGGLRVAF